MLLGEQYPASGISYHYHVRRDTALDSHRRRCLRALTARNLSDAQDGFLKDKRFLDP